MRKTHLMLPATVALLALLAGGWFGITRQSLGKRGALLREIAQEQILLASLPGPSDRQPIGSSTDQPTSHLASMIPPVTELNKTLAEIWSAAAADSLQTMLTRPLPQKRIAGCIDQEIELGLLGNVADFQRFLLHLENTGRIVRIEKMNLSASTKDAPGKMEITLSVLFAPPADDSGDGVPK